MIQLQNSKHHLQLQYTAKHQLSIDRGRGKIFKIGTLILQTPLLLARGECAKSTQIMFLAIRHNHSRSNFYSALMHIAAGISLQERAFSATNHHGAARGFASDNLHRLHTMMVILTHKLLSSKRNLHHHLTNSAKFLLLKLHTFRNPASKFPNTFGKSAFFQSQHNPTIICFSASVKYEELGMAPGTKRRSIKVVSPRQIYWSQSASH